MLPPDETLPLDRAPPIIVATSKGLVALLKMAQCEKKGFADVGFKRGQTSHAWHCFPNADVFENARVADVLVNHMDLVMVRYAEKIIRALKQKKQQLVTVKF